MLPTRTKLDVAVYLTGIVIRPRFLGPVAILAPEIQELDMPNPLVLGESVAIRHTSSDLASP
jgi:hypothetical protein